MSEPQARPSAARGRGSGRGGRGGYSARGGRARQASKSDAAAAPSYEDEGEIGQLKRQYAPKLNTIREMFPDWTDEDLVFALQETDGDLEATIERISEGNVSQWGEVKKKTKDRAKSKAKEDGHDAGSSARAGRGRGSDATRGRARGAERGGRGAARGRGGAITNGSKKTVDSTNEPSAAAEESVSWSAAADAAAEKRGSVSPDAGSWEMVTPSDAAPPAAEQPKPASKPEGGASSWASLLKPAPAPKPQPAPVKSKATATPAVPPAQAKSKAVPTAGDPEIGKPPAPKPAAEDVETTPVLPESVPVADLTPSKDELTETNLEQVQDVSHPVASETVASNAGTAEVRSVTGSATPSQSTQQPAAARPGLGGFATTAHKATSGSTRGPSFQRRVKDQQEAVVMPGHHAVDRAAVQFGSLGLGEQEDVDGDREEPETRTQPPQHSPVAPRASLPPAAQQPAADAALGGTRPAPGLPPVASQVQQSDPAMASQVPGVNYGYNQFNSIYGGGITQGEAAAAQTKPFDSFGQHGQPGASHGLEGYPPHSQAATQGGAQPGAFSSAGSDYPSFYSSDSQRNAYQNYYGAYGHQAQPGPQDSPAAQQKAGLMGAAAEAQAPGAGAQTQANAQSRFPGSAEAQPSGHSTPNPPLGHQAGQGPQSHQVGQGHTQAGGHGYPYGGNPYYNHPYYSSSYVNQMNHHQYGPERPPFDDARRYEEFFGHSNQYGYAGRHAGYGAGPYAGGAAGGGGGGGAGAGAGAGAKYAPQHSGYGMSSQSPFDAHSASPANAGSYGQPQQSLPGRDSAGLGGYGRTATTQPGDGQSHNSSGFGGMSDVFSRSQSGFSAQTSQQQSSQQGAGDDGSRGFADTSKIAGGPSPAPGQAGARPGSAANHPGQSNAPTSQAQAYGGYPSQMGQMHGQQSQYGTGLGGLGGHGGAHHQQGGAHQNNVYGYGGFGGNYYSNTSRGGWGGNYGH